MSQPKVSASFAVVESSENLVDTLDAHKTSLAFPVLSVPARPGEVGDFMGIISRARWVQRGTTELCIAQTASFGVCIA